MKQSILGISGSAKRILGDTLRTMLSKMGNAVTSRLDKKPHVIEGGGSSSGSYLGTGLPLIADIRRAEVDKGHKSIIYRIYGIDKTVKRETSLYAGPNFRANRYLRRQYLRMIRVLDGEAKGGFVEWRVNHKELNLDKLSRKNIKSQKRNYRKFWTIGMQLLTRSIIFRTALITKVLSKDEKWFHRHFDLEKLHNLNKGYCKIATLGWCQRVPMRRVWIPAGEKYRPLSVPTLAWRVYLRGLAAFLEVFMKNSWPKNQHGFTTGRGTFSAWRVILRKVINYKFIFEFDLQGYYNSVRLERVGIELFKRKVPKYMIAHILGLTSSEIEPMSDMDLHKLILDPVWVKIQGSYEFIHSFREGWRSRGLPQGLGISPVLSLLPLTVLDKLESIGVHTLLYADDGILYGDKELDYGSEAQRVLDQEHTGAILSVQKSKWVRWGGRWLESLKFLGLRYDPFKDTLSASTRAGASISMHRRVLVMMDQSEGSSLSSSDRSSSSTSSSPTLECPVIDDLESKTWDELFKLMLELGIGYWGYVEASGSDDGARYRLLILIEKVYSAMWKATDTDRRVDLMTHDFYDWKLLMVHLDDLRSEEKVTGMRREYREKNRGKTFIIQPEDVLWRKVQDEKIAYKEVDHDLLLSMKDMGEEEEVLPEREVPLEGKPDRGPDLKDNIPRSKPISRWAEPEIQPTNFDPKVIAKQYNLNENDSSAVAIFLARQAAQQEARRAKMSAALVKSGVTLKSNSSNSSSSEPVNERTFNRAKAMSGTDPSAAQTYQNLVSTGYTPRSNSRSSDTSSPSNPSIPRTSPMEGSLGKDDRIQRPYWAQFPYFEARTAKQPNLEKGDWSPKMKGLEQKIVRRDDRVIERAVPVEWSEKAVKELGVDAISAAERVGWRIALGVGELNWRNQVGDETFKMLISRLYMDSWDSGTVEQSFKLTVERGSLVDVMSRAVGWRGLSVGMGGGSFDIFNATSAGAYVLMGLLKEWSGVRGFGATKTIRPNHLPQIAMDRVIGSLWGRRTSFMGRLRKRFNFDLQGRLRENVGLWRELRRLNLMGFVEAYTQVRAKELAKNLLVNAYRFKSEDRDRLLNFIFKTPMLPYSPPPAKRGVWKAAGPKEIFLKKHGVPLEVVLKSVYSEFEFWRREAIDSRPAGSCWLTWGPKMGNPRKGRSDRRSIRRLKANINRPKLGV